MLQPALSQLPAPPQLYGAPRCRCWRRRQQRTAVAAVLPLRHARDLCFRGRLQPKLLSVFLLLCGPQKLPRKEEPPPWTGVSGHMATHRLHSPQAGLPILCLLLGRRLAAGAATAFAGCAGPQGKLAVCPSPPP